LRAPIFEEKVVDFLVELADVTEKSVSREDLFKEDEAPAGQVLTPHIQGRSLVGGAGDFDKRRWG
jgi:hypothetical protein